MQPYKICCLTYKQLDKLVASAIEGLNDPELKIFTYECLREEVIAALSEAEAAGVEVVIGGGANAKIAREYSSVPVLEYRLTVYDYLAAIDKAFMLGTQIALVSYRTPMPQEFGRYLERLGIRCTNIIYENTEDLREKILADSGAVIIGPAHANEVAQELGRKCVLIYPGQAAVLETITYAKKMARELRRQSEHARFSQAVINYSTNALVLISPDGKIIDFNTAAQQLFGKSGAAVKGAPASEVIPESGISDFFAAQTDETTAVHTIRGRDVFCRWVRLEGKREGHIGTVGILSDMSDINRAQMEHQDKLQRERAEKGFTAKMHFSDIVGDSAPITMAIGEAQVFARSEASLLLYGETGVGKEIFAQSIHNEGTRRSEPFIAINCAALPENLLESELFGYDEGAFTGGKKGGKKGLFELASHGTLFLDEIGELSPALQTRLLRVLQEREIMHIGGDRVIPVDVRVISATNRDLEHMPVESFRRDLFYRLSVLELRLPSLRERGEDTQVLFAHFLSQHTNIARYQAEFPPPLGRIVSLYSWPGNIRELQNVCERYVLYTDNLPERGEKALKRCLVRAVGEKRLFQDVISRYEPIEKNLNSTLVALLQDVFSYTKEQVGDRLGVSRTTIWRLTK